jgi:hypothetical protein
MSKPEEFLIVEKKYPKINQIVFNQTENLIGVATEKGFRIYSSNLNEDK